MRSQRNGRFRVDTKFTLRGLKNIASRLWVAHAPPEKSEAAIVCVVNVQPVHNDSLAEVDSFTVCEFDRYRRRDHWRKVQSKAVPSFSILFQESFAVNAFEEITLTRRPHTQVVAFFDGLEVRRVVWI